MGKKHSNVKKNGESKGPSSSGDIFKTLFGEIAEKGPSSSIFSDDNPFRRKPSDPSQTPQQNQQPKQLGFGSVENEESPENGEVQNPNAVEGKKRKRIKEKDEVSDIELASLGEGSVAPLEISKLKKKTKSSVESENFGSESKALSKKAKGKNHLGKGAREDLNLGAKLKERDEKENHNVGMELNGVVDSEKKTKKKRKRDELESEYEARRYGEVVVKDESGERGLGGGAVVGEKRKTLDSAEDMLASKEGFDDEDKLLRTVFVGNLPLKVKKKALLREFSQFGDVDSVRIRSVPIVNVGAIHVNNFIFVLHD